MQTKLTPAFVKAAQCAPGAERTFFWDSALSGFGLQVTGTGHRSFVVQYKSGKQSRRMAISGVLDLTAARKQAKVILGAVAKGGDPLSERRTVERAARDTLSAVAQEYLAREGSRLRGLAKRTSTLNRLILPALGAQQIGDIRRSGIVRLLDRIEDENGPHMAQLALATLRRIMNWHAARSDDFRSPVVRGMTRTNPSESARERVLSDDELRAVWRTAEAQGDAFAYLIRFLLLTAVRRLEAAQMHRGELDGTDWLIPAARYKSKRDMLVPLSTAAQALLAEIPVIARDDDQPPFVFTAIGRCPIANFGKAKDRFDAACGVANWRLHDLRRTARSLMSRAGVSADVAERCLGHALSGVRQTYDRYAYRAEKLQAFEALAAQIARILDPVPNVVALRAR